jgi:rRNA maturation endonuclease Nob1
MICPDCNTVNRSFVEFCLKCGAQLYRKLVKKENTNHKKSLLGNLVNIR